MSITHAKVSAKSDGGDATLILPSDWNAAHTGEVVGLIGRTLLGADTAAITFSSIPSTYEHLQLFGQVRGAPTGNSLIMTLNNDGGGNYSGMFGYVVSAGTWSMTERLIGSVNFWLGYFTGSDGTANYADPLEIVIPNYKRTTFYKTVRSKSGAYNAAGAGTSRFIQEFGGYYASTTAISRIDFTFNGGNILSGTDIALYGVNG